jgi:CubicO group peptidase (beta-lactamase class C family)
MKRNCRIFSLLLALLISFSAAAQTAQERNDAMYKLVEKHFNQRNGDSLYALTNDAFQKQISHELFMNILNGQLFPLGNMQQSGFLNIKNGVSFYKVNFANATLQMLVGVDSSNKMSTFAVQPYKDSEAQKSVAPATSNPLKTALDKTIDSAIRSYTMLANTVGLSVGVLKDGKMTIYGYGETAKDNGQIPSGNTIFEIGSISKTFTATLLAYNVIEGKVKLTDPITKYLPDSVAANKELAGITLQMLSNHTSGLPRLPINMFFAIKDSLNPYREYDKAMLFSYLKEAKPATTPGSTYAYSNLGVGLLGVILERVNGKGFETMVKDIICKPLKMNNTMQRVTGDHLKQFASVHDDGKVTSAWDFDAMAAAGSLRSTAQDLLLYAAANLKDNDQSKLGKAINLTHQLTFQGQRNVGLGWHQEKTNGGEIYYVHTGGTGGSSSLVAWVPGKDIAVVTLSNASETVSNTGIDLLMAVLGMK